jgi:subtilase family serine protease
MACMVLVNTGVAQHAQGGPHPDAAPQGDGYGPASLQDAYNLPSSTAGSGRTVAVVDAYDDPNAASDLAAYRTAWGLPACGTGCFRKVNQNGQASPLPTAARSTGWATEESLDLDMVSAICPLCHIILVEASNAGTANLGTGVNSAVSLGAQYVSNSYGGGESSSDSSLDTSYFKHPGVVITASAGDSGYGVSYPAASPFVTAVGGTALTPSSSPRGWTESVWGSSSGGEGTGSGCSAHSAKPSWQTDTGCANRTDNDVAADADPSTGVAVYDTYDQNGWLEVGGTSASSPMIASVYALAGAPATGTYPVSYLYAHTASLFDVTTGADGSCSSHPYLCTAGPGYDGPTGWGTPDGVAAFTSGGASPNTVTVTTPGGQASTVGTAVSLAVHASDSAQGQTLTYTAAGLPAGLSISPSTGLITGTPTTAATGSVTVTATDTTSAFGSASFSWAVTGAQGGGCTAAQLLANPGFETGNISPWTATSGVLARTSSGVPAHSGSWLAWLDGYGGSHTDTVAQTVTIPAGCTTATLAFWLDVSTNDPAGQASDTFKVQILNSGGTVLATLATYSNQNSAGGYAQHSFSLAPYIGRQITVKYTGTETLRNHVTSFYEDDNALNVS